MDKTKVSKKQVRFSLIQVFRGIAALLVVCVHGNSIFNTKFNQDFLEGFFSFGGAGVDFFFVLSGFIIYYVHQSDIGSPSRIKPFLLKRFIRLYPIYWIVLAAKLIASIGFSYADTNQRAIADIVKAFLLVPQNQTVLSSSFIGVGWTLSYEVFFYLIFALLIYATPKVSIPIITVWLSGVTLNFVGILELSSGPQMYDGYTLVDFVFSALHLEFVAGCLVAHFISKQRIKHSTSKLILYASALILIVFLMNADLLESLQIPSVVIAGVPVAFLILGATSLEINKPASVPPILILVGDASYSIYLIHGFVMNSFTSAMSKLDLSDAFTQNAVSLCLYSLMNVAAVILVGCCLYLYVEKPLITVLRRALVHSVRPAAFRE